MTKPENLLFIGEPMLELVSTQSGSLKTSFAGDVYNTSVYIKRAFPSNQVHFMTAIGQDKLSNDFISQVKSEDIDTSYIGLSSNKHMGAYMVLNDEDGERSFIYWRNDSAAKRMMSLLPDIVKEDTDYPFAYIFFSGITLAILDKVEREAFWQFIASAKAKGVSLIFDPNYRPLLWSDASEAKAQFEIAYQHSDWLLPGLDDFKALYGIDSIEACIDFCRDYKFTELVIKQGHDPVYVITSEGTKVIEIQRSSNVVDTTSAGDAFNGVYIGARLSSKTPKESVLMANYAAMKVIETRGAIMPKPLFIQAMSSYKPK